MSSPNPDVDQLGPGPAGCRCGECGNLAATRIPTRTTPSTVGASPAASPSPLAGEGWGEGAPRRVSEEQTVYYCLVTSQAKRVTWPACSRFVPFNATTTERLRNMSDEQLVGAADAAAKRLRGT